MRVKMKMKMKIKMKIVVTRLGVKKFLPLFATLNYLFFKFCLFLFVTS